jgi:hypothetical protein
MADREHHTIANDVTHAHGVVWQTVADTAALNALTIVAEDIAQQKVILQNDTRELWVPLTVSPSATFRHLIIPATTSIAGEMSAADKAKLDSIASGADVALPSLATHVGDHTNPHAVTAAQVGAVPTSRAVNTSSGILGGGSLGSGDLSLTCDFGSGAGKVCQGNDARLTDSKLMGYQNEIATGVATGTSQPLSLADSIFTGKSTQATPNLTAPTGTGIAAGSFASSGAETGTSATQGGLGTAASSTQPYNTTDFPGYRKARVLILKVDDDELTLSDIVPATTGADANAPVYGYLSFRSDLGTNLKWRLWFYYRRSSDGFEVPVTPTQSVSNCKFYVVEVLTLQNLPGSALVNRSIAGQLPGEMVFGATADLVTLGTATAGATGKVMDAGSRLQMPRLDQLLAPTAAVGGNNQEATSWADPTAAGSLVTRNFLEKSVIFVDALATAALPAYTKTGSGVGATITANVNGAAPTLDATYTPQVGDKFLLPVGIAAAAADSGVWQWTSVGGVGSTWSAVRYAGLDTGAKVAGSKLRIRYGLSAGFEYSFVNPTVPTVDTDPLFWFCTSSASSLVELVRVCDEEFLWGGVNTNATAANNPNGLLYFVAGASATVTILARGSNTGTRNGVAQLNTGTATTGNSFLGHTGGFLMSTNVGFIVEGKHGFPTLSDGTNPYAGWIGWGDSLTATPTNGVIAQYDQANNANLRLVTVNAGTATKTDSGVAVSAGSDLHWWMVKFPGSQQVKLYVAGALGATDSGTNVPSGNVTSFMMNLIKGGGTAARTMEVDAVRAVVALPGRRAA